MLVLLRQLKETTTLEDVQVRECRVSQIRKYVRSDVIARVVRLQQMSMHRLIISDTAKIELQRVRIAR